MTGDHLTTSGGVHTHFTDEGTGEPVVVLHGFSGSTETMAGLAAQLVTGHRVIRIDLIGHGYSEKPDDPSRYTMDTSVGQVLDVVGDRTGRPVHVVGYSMGARVALAAALTAPDRIKSVVLIGGTPGISDPQARADRQRADSRLADEIEAHGVEWFADEWMQKPFFVTQRRLGESHLAAARAQRMENAPHALANSLRTMGTGAQESYWHLLATLHAPVLYVAGEADPKFTSIGEQIVAAVPNGLLVVVPGAGHAAHVEAERDVAAVIEYFFKRDRRGPFE